MKIFTKHMLAGLVISSLALGGSVVAGDKDVDVRHKVIEIKAQTDEDVKIKVKGDSETQTVVLEVEDLNDDAMIEQKLAHLDDETRETVLNALQGIKHIGKADFTHPFVSGDIDKKVMVMHKGDSELAFVHGDADMDFEFTSDDGEHLVRKHIIIGGEQQVLKGHTNAIVRLIEKGEFSQDELDKIQAAVDAKR